MIIFRKCSVYLCLIAFFFTGCIRIPFIPSAYTPDLKNIIFDFNTDGIFTIYAQIFKEDWEKAGPNRWHGVINSFIVKQTTSDGIKIPDYSIDLKLFKIEKKSHFYRNTYTNCISVSPISSSNNYGESHQINVFITMSKRPGDLTFKQQLKNSNNVLSFQDKSNFIIDGLHPNTVSVNQLNFYLSINTSNKVLRSKKQPDNMSYFPIGIELKDNIRYKVTGYISGTEKGDKWEKSNNTYSGYMQSFNGMIGKKEFDCTGLKERRLTDDRKQYCIITERNIRYSKKGIIIIIHGSQKYPPFLNFEFDQISNKNVFFPIQNYHFMLGPDRIQPYKIQFQSGQKYPEVHLYFTEHDTVTINSLNKVQQNIISHPRIVYTKNRIITETKFFSNEMILPFINNGGKPRLQFKYGWIDYQLKHNQYVLDLNPYFSSFQILELENKKPVPNVLVSIRPNNHNSLIYQGLSDHTGKIYYINWGFSFGQLKIRVSKQGYHVSAKEDRTFYLSKRLNWDIKTCYNENPLIHHNGLLVIRRNGTVVAKLEKKKTITLPWIIEENQLDNYQFDYEDPNGAYEYRTYYQNNTLHIQPTYIKQNDQTMIVFDVTEKPLQESYLPIAKNAIINSLENIQWKANKDYGQMIKVGYAYGENIDFINSLEKIRNASPIYDESSFHKQIMKAFSKFSNQGSKNLIYIVSDSRAINAREPLLHHNIIEEYRQNGSKFHCVLMGVHSTNEFLLLARKLGGKYRELSNQEEISNFISSIIFSQQVSTDRPCQISNY